MAAYYNEFDPNAADWLEHLIAAGVIAPGHVDRRSIVEVRPDDLTGYSQCHFFAGIGGWSYALRLAGVPDDRPVWTGSCPCQPFSAAGKQQGFADERHLWPHWFRLIIQHRPATLFGEQVAAAIKGGWLDLVCADLEGQDYAIGAAVLPACSVGAPHIRQRLWFVAHAQCDAAESGRAAIQSAEGIGTQEAGSSVELGRCGLSGELVNAERARLEGHTGDGDNGNQPGWFTAQQDGSVATPSRASFWSDCDWLPCIDGKSRPVESCTFPLVDGISFKLGSGSTFEGKSRQGLLRGYGNAIVPQLAAAFITAAL